MLSDNLSNVPVGDMVYVSGLTNSGNMRRRLLDIGLTEGTGVKCLFKSPSGNPAAYLIRGAVIALRNEDASSVRILH